MKSFYVRPSEFIIFVIGSTICLTLSQWYNYPQDKTPVVYQIIYLSMPFSAVVNRFIVKA